MIPDPRRKFTLLDALVLIAATAVGLALMRSSGRGFRPPDWSGRDWPIALIFEVGRVSWFFLTAWGPALLGLRLVAPRPRLKVVLRRPGAVACCAMTLAMALQASTYLLLAATMGTQGAYMRGFLTRRTFVDEPYASAVAMTVLGAWLALILVGRWRPEPTWIDRTGRVLGLAWIAGAASVQGAVILLALFYS